MIDLNIDKNYLIECCENILLSTDAYKVDIILRYDNVSKPLIITKFKEYYESDKK